MENRNMNLEGLTVLCAASSYEQKFYLNDRFAALPDQIKQELQILCVMYTEEIGGVLTLAFEEDGTLILQSAADDADYLYDEVGSILKIREIQTEKRELLEALELYYRVFFLGLSPEEADA